MTPPLLFAALAMAGQELPLLEGPGVVPEPPPAPLLFSLRPMPILAPPAPAMPEAVRTMIEAAYKTGDDKAIATVIGLAKGNFPLWIDQIELVSQAQNKLLLTARKEEQEREQQRIANARFLQIWKGQLEGGVSRQTGSSRTFGFYASAKLTRDGLRWRQQITARVDYQQTNHVPTTDRILAAWQPNYKLNDTSYLYGLGQYEHDRFLGYDNRGTLGVGIGYQVASRSNLKLVLEAGPAIRRTDFVGLPPKTTIAGRGSVSLRWALSPSLVVTEEGAVFIESADETASSVTGIETTLIGALKARLSYNVQFERESIDTTRQLDTTTRATLLYAF